MEILRSDELISWIDILFTLGWLLKLPVVVVGVVEVVVGAAVVKGVVGVAPVEGVIDVVVVGEEVVVVVVSSSIKFGTMNK